MFGVWRREQLVRIEALYQAKAEALEREHAERLEQAEGQQRMQAAAVHVQLMELLGQMRTATAVQVQDAYRALEKQVRVAGGSMGCMSGSAATICRGPLAGSLIRRW